MQNIKIEIDGVTKKLELIGLYESDSSHHCINGKWYREVEEKDYEILSFRRIDLGFIQSLENGLYLSKSGDSSLTLLQMLDAVKKGYAVIHSVRRLSDGEVFTVKKDKEKFAGFIKSFEILSNNRIIVKYDNTDVFYCHYLDQLKRSNFIEDTPTVLLTTEDGVNITDRQHQLLVLTSFFNKMDCLADYISKFPSSKFFSTEEARDEYIINNKPITITLSDFKSIANEDYPYYDQEDVLNLFKSKQKII